MPSELWLQYILYVYIYIYIPIHVHTIEWQMISFSVKGQCIWGWNHKCYVAKSVILSACPREKTAWFSHLTHLRCANRIQSQISWLVWDITGVQCLPQHLLFSLLTQGNIAIACGKRIAKWLPTLLNHHPKYSARCNNNMKMLYSISCHAGQRLWLHLFSVPPTGSALLNTRGGWREWACIYTLFNSSFPIVPLL